MSEFFVGGWREFVAGLAAGTLLLAGFVLADCQRHLAAAFCVVIGGGLVGGIIATGLIEAIS